MSTKEETKAKGEVAMFEQVEIARFTPKERRQYEESMKEYWDTYSILTTAEKKGREERSVEIARSMKAKGYAVADIADITGLSKDKIEQL